MGSKVFGLYILLSILSLNCVGKVSAIDCWVCTSDHSACGETIDETSLQASRLTQSGCAGCGKKFTSLGTVFSKVERTCLDAATDTCDNKLGYGYCTCSTTYCNSANSISFCFLTVLCSIIFFLGFQFL